MMLGTEQTLAANTEHLIRSLPERVANPKLASRIGIGDKTLWNVRGSRPNPELKTVEAIARYFRIEVWQLLAPELGQALLPRHRLDQTTTVSELTAALAQHLEDKPALRELVKALVLRYENDPSEGDRIAEAIKTIMSR